MKCAIRPMLFAVHEFFIKATNTFNKLTHIALGYSWDSHYDVDLGRCETLSGQDWNFVYLST